MVENTVTLTCRDGLAYVVGSSAGPTQIIRCYTRDHRRAQSIRNSGTQYSVSCCRVANRKDRGHQTNDRGMARVEAGGSDSDQQPVEKQNGKWHKETARERRSIYNPSPSNWRGNRGDWLLAFGQLLVSGPGNGIGDGGLTPVKRPSRSWRSAGSARRRRRGRGHVFRRGGGRKLVSWGPIFQSRERLAPCRGVRKRRPEPLTSRPLRKEWGRHHG